MKLSGTPRRRTTTLRTTAAALALACGAALGACGGGSDKSAATSDGATTDMPAAAPQGSTTDKVAIAGFAFKPEVVDVQVGTTVTWTNQDATKHSVVDDKSAFKSADLDQNQPFTHLFATKGTFTYHCGIHNYMTGTVVVR